MTPIIRYLKEGWLPEDKAEARKIQTKAARFVIIDDMLYRRGYSLPYLRCTNSLPSLCDILTSCASHGYC